MKIEQQQHVIVNQQVLKNAVSNYLGRIIVMGTGFVLTPFILSHLNETMYGLWVLAGSAASYGSLFDLGIRSSVVKYVAEYHAKGELNSARRLIATALTVYAILGLILFAIFAILAPLFPQLFSLPAEQHSTAIWLVLLSGLSVGLSIPCGTAPAILWGLQRFDLVNLVNAAGMLLYAFGVVVVLLGGGGAVGLVTVGIVASLAMQVPSIYLINKIAPDLHFGLRGAGMDMARTITSFSWSLFLLNLNGYLETKTDEIVVGANLPVSAVTPYNIAHRLSVLPQMLAEQFLSLILPLASVLDAKDDRVQLRSLYIISTRLTLALFIPLAIILSIWADSILSLWVGNTYARYANLVLILTVASLIDTSQWPAGLVLQGMARHRLLSVVSLTSGITNLVLSIALVRVYGLEGVAVGTLIPTTIVCFGFVLPYSLKLLRVSPRSAVVEMFLPALLPAAPTLVWMILWKSILGSNSPFSSALGVGTGLLIYGFGFLAQRINADERRAFRDLTLVTLRGVRTYMGIS